LATTLHEHDDRRHSLIHGGESRLALDGLSWKTESSCRWYVQPFFNLGVSHGYIRGWIGRLPHGSQVDFESTSFCRCGSLCDHLSFKQGRKSSKGAQPKSVVGLKCQTTAICRHTHWKPFSFCLPVGAKWNEVNSSCSHVHSAQIKRVLLHILIFILVLSPSKLQK
jgi:hypothetical protein